jgi:hypothetical protein
MEVSVARAIVRFSLDGDYGSATTNRVRAELQARGVMNIGTSVYKGFAELDTITDAIRAELDVLDQPSGSASLDHLLVYVDRRTPMA